MVAPYEHTLRRLELALAIAIPAAFLAVALINARPFVDDVPLASPDRDDWFFYKQLAVSIVNDGLSMPAIGSYVVLPHGFLYPYFLAAIFFVTGINASYVYVIQSLLAGVSAVVLWRVVRRHAGPLIGITFLVAEAAVLYLDFVRRLSFKLLSENLFLILFSLFLVALARAAERPTNGRAATAGVLLGLTTLARTSITVSAIGIVILLFVFRGRGGGVPARAAIAFAAAFVLTMFLLPLREWAAIGRPNFDLILNNSDWVPPPGGIAERAEYYGRRVLFALGFTGFVIPEFRFRPHWFLAWCGLAAYLMAWFRSRRRPDLVEASLLVFLPCYLGAVILVATIDNYGGRMLAAAIPFALVLAARANQRQHEGHE